MSWDKELWVAVSLIQSAPHRAGQYTACLNCPICFPLDARMHNVSCSRFLPIYTGSDRDSHACELIRTKFLCVSHKQAHILPTPTATHTQMQFQRSSLSDTHTEICLHLNSKTTLGSKFSSLTAFFCHSVLIWADLYCAVCTFNAIILLMTQLAVVLGGLVKSLLSCILKRN